MAQGADRAEVDREDEFPSDFAVRYNSLFSLSLLHKLCLPCSNFIWKLCLKVTNESGTIVEAKRGSNWIKETAACMRAEDRRDGGGVIA